jgi:hypothetical protein
MKLLIMQSSPASRLFLPPLNTLFSNALNQLSSLRVTDQVSHPYEIAPSVSQVVSDVPFKTKALVHIP